MTGIVSDNVGRTSGLIKAVSVGGGAWTLIKTLTSDGSDATMSFVNGSDDVTLDSTYPIYVFKFINIHPETNDTHFSFNGSVDTGSNYNVTKTTINFRAHHSEGATSDLSYRTGGDIAQNSGRHTGLVKAPEGAGVWTLIKTLTSGGSDDDLSFVDGTSDVVLDSTYDQYVFKVVNIHPEEDNKYLQFQGNVAGGSGYNETITSTSFYSYHDEADGNTSLSYAAGNDQAQGTGFQTISDETGNGNDECCSGHLWLFNPSDTTFVTHFQARFNTYYGANYSVDSHIAGYFNLTGAIDEIQFKFSSGEIQAGSISLYGIT